MRTLYLRVYHLSHIYLSPKRARVGHLNFPLSFRLDHQNRAHESCAESDPDATLFEKAADDVCFGLRFIRDALHLVKATCDLRPAT